MATINSLMKHLRENGVQISGSTQKRKLRRIGYYHGYKGYRFAGTSLNRLPITDFDEIVALHDFDMRLKSIFYEPLMSVETALKNRVLEAVLEHSGSEQFEVIYKTSLTAYRCCSGKREYKDAWTSRLRLHAEIDQLIARSHRNKAVISHFCDKDMDIPIWAIFEIMTLGNFGAFYGCLHDDAKKAICVDLKMPIRNFDSAAVLKKIIFSLKDLRNAVAHNGIILDVRFKTGQVHKSVGSLLKNEMGAQGIEFKEIADYAVLLVYLMTKLGFTKMERKRFLSSFVDELEKYRSVVPFSIYSQFVGTQARSKVEAARRFTENH